MAASRTKPCGVEIQTSDSRHPAICQRPRARTKTKCIWHHLLGRPIEQQVTEARRRAGNPHFMNERARVPESEWPPGERWCAGCQSFVPLFYSSGSRCKACSSQAAHASHVKRTYDLDPAEYDRLLEWQAGRCYVCGQVPRVRRLAVDHDHKTGAVRGLLCANDEWGCNVMLSRILNDAEAAKRLVEYVERFPIDRMRDGEPGKVYRRPPGTMELLRDWKPPAQPLDDDWDPFGK